MAREKGQEGGDKWRWRRTSSDGGRDAAGGGQQMARMEESAIPGAEQSVVRAEAEIGRRSWENEWQIVCGGERRGREQRKGRHGRAAAHRVLPLGKKERPGARRRQDETTTRQDDDCSRPALACSASPLNLVLLDNCCFFCTSIACCYSALFLPPPTSRNFTRIGPIPPANFPCFPDAGLTHPHAIW